MANEEHVKQLKQGVVEWNAWCERKRRSAADEYEELITALDAKWRTNPKIAGLRGLIGADPRGASAKNAHLYAVHADLIGADLRWTNLNGADLHGASLENANLREVDLHGAGLSGANLTSADLHGAKLSDVDLSRANLTSANLRGSNLSDADLSRANLTDANLRDANLRRANLRRATLDCTNLNDADLRGADLRDAYLGRAHLFAAIASMRTYRTAACDAGSRRTT